MGAKIFTWCHNPVWVYESPLGLSANSSQTVVYEPLLSSKELAGHVALALPPCFQLLKRS